MCKIKVVVVDDDAVARNQIKSHIGNNSKYDVVGEFADGNAAIAWLRENEPDILVCDMQMPKMMGTELMQIVRGMYEYLPILVISAYDDFTYARESIHSGAVDYVLKSELDTKNLDSILDSICVKYHIGQKEHRISNRIGYKFTGDFQKDKIVQMVDEKSIDFSLDYMCCIVVSPDYKVVENINIDTYRRDILNAVEDILRQILGTGQYILCVSNMKCLRVLLSFGEVKSYMYAINTVNNICSKLNRRVARMLDTTLTIGLGSIQLELDALLKQCHELEEIVKNKFYLGINRIYNVETETKIKQAEYHVPAWEMSRLKLNICNDQTREVQAQLEEIFREYAKIRCNRHEILIFVEEMLNVYEEKRNLDVDKKEQLLYKVKQMQTLDDIKIFLIQLSEQTEKQHYVSDGGELSALSVRAEEYIQQHYSEDISLESCATYVGISYTHLSRTFKKEFGVNFVEYLNQIRIQKAQSLLVSPNNSIKECAKMVGFHNYSYFFKVFKQNVGMTPNEFIAKYCNKR